MGSPNTQLIFEFLPIPLHSLLVNAYIDTQSLHYGIIGIRKIYGKRVSIQTTDVIPHSKDGTGQEIPNEPARIRARVFVISVPNSEPHGIRLPDIGRTLS